MQKIIDQITYTLSEKFDRKLGEDDMDDLERVMDKIKYWNSSDRGQYLEYRWILSLFLVYFMRKLGIM